MSAFDPGRHRILCVDDEPNILSALRRMLSMEGYPVSVAESGQAALNLLVQDKPDVIICDMRMPQMTGVEVLSKPASSAP